MWTTVKKILYAVFLLISITILISFVILWYYSPGKTPISSDNNSIHESLMLNLGGFPQFVTLHGNSILNPLLIVVHGGPGDPIAPQLAIYNQNLRDNFIVVTWDQRGAGRSYSENLDPATMTPSQIVRDGADLLVWLAKKFPNKPKMLLGHSWGSYIGIQIAHKYPSELCAYIGTGQVSNQVESERLSYQWLRDAVKRNGDENYAQKLRDIGPPVNGIYAGGLDAFMMQRKGLREYGGAASGKNNLEVLWIFAKSILFYQEYRLIDKLNFIRGETYSMALMEETLFSQPLDIKQLEIPFAIIQGSDDKQTMTSLARDFYLSIQAPHKSWYEIEKAAHLLPFEHPDRFNHMLTEISEDHCR